MDRFDEPSVLHPTLVTVEVPADPSAITALVERAKKGELEAFNDLIRFYQRRIISIGIQMGLSRDDALDACQDAFIKVFRYIDGFRSGESFYKWLYRIAVNSVYDHLRRARSSKNISIDEWDKTGEANPSRTETPLATRIENSDLARKLLAQLHCLTRQERIVFVMRDIHEMPTQEIGRILSLSQITVRRHCLTARQKLRERLFPRKS
jgi:RNA polymerase sigma-70 factor (ECF subfamily)